MPVAEGLARVPKQPGTAPSPVPGTVSSRGKRTARGASILPSSLDYLGAEELVHYLLPSRIEAHEYEVDEVEDRESDPVGL